MPAELGATSEKDNRGEEIMKSLTQELIKSLKQNISDVTGESLEIGMDHFLNDGILKEIPFIKYIYTVNKMRVDVRDIIFLRKLMKFYNQLSSVSTAERIEFLNKYEGEEHSLGERIILLADRADSFEKMELIGKVFVNCIKGFIKLNMCHRLCNVINSTYLEDLRFLQTQSDKGFIFGIEAQGLATSGLAIRKSFDGGTFDSLSDNPIELYAITTLGIKLKTYAFGVQEGDVQSENINGNE